MRILMLPVLAAPILPAVAADAQDRTLGLLVNETANCKYMSSFMLARSAGMQETTISQGWDQLETAPCKYDSKLLDIASSFYPGQNTTITLVITTIDTNNLRLPSDLKGKRFDDPVVIARFQNLLSFVMERTKHLQFQCLSIGNEVDVYLKNDPDKWRQYMRFFAAASDYARKMRPGLLVGCKTTFHGCTAACPAHVRGLNEKCNVLMLTYYPVDSTTFMAQDPATVFSDFEKVVSLYPHKPIYILEAGYPSSALLRGSEERQAAFVCDAFKAWDRTKEHIKLVEFLWLNDMTNTELDFFGKYYGSSAPGLVPSLVGIEQSRSWCGFEQSVSRGLFYFIDFFGIYFCCFAA